LSPAVVVISLACWPDDYYMLGAAVLSVKGLNNRPPLLYKFIPSRLEEEDKKIKPSIMRDDG
jgi:hypothetical protein